MIQILTTSIAPVIVISVAGLLLLSITSRHGRAIDRARLLAPDLEESDPESARRSNLGDQLRFPNDRAHVLRSLMLYASASISFVSLTILSLFAEQLLQSQNDYIALRFFALCLLSLMVSMYYPIRDITMSLSALELEVGPDAEIYTCRGETLDFEGGQMKRIPSGTELARPFLPARDFELSKAFYEALGFEKLLDGDVAIFRTGSGGFILQRAYQKEWADNFMMQLMVDDLDAWWTHIQALDLPGRFHVRAPRTPAMQPWGLRIAYVVDPSGVLWHIAERRDGAVQD